MSLYSPTTLSICCCRAKEPYLEVMATVFFFPWGRNIKKMNLLHCFAVTKEIAIGGGTSGILYNLFPKVIITTLGRDSYTA